MLPKKAAAIRPLAHLRKRRRIFPGYHIEPYAAGSIRLILDDYLHLPATDWIAAFHSAKQLRERNAAQTEQHQEQARAADSRPSLPLSSYAGGYADAWYGPATIRAQNGRLVMSMDHTPNLVGELQHWQYDTFKTHWRDRTLADAFVYFALKPDGSIEHFKMAAVSPLADFSFDFQDLLFIPASQTSGKR